ncbi:MAG: carbon-nitrogen hydrolase family protein [Gemmatimonadota bacterium]|nr:carbon-nitrogen hydrolase family protein [Gemmatimonadota bacterium]
MRVAVVTEVFFGVDGAERLDRCLGDARNDGAELVVLPELPLNGWAPHSKTPRDEDAEPPDGPRQRVMADAARRAGVALVGGAIVRDPRTGARHNTALVYHPDGACVARYRKVHLPEEEGYWETSHYERGDEAPPVVDGLPLRVGLQICSDVNRPHGFQLLAARHAEVVCAPRATPPETYDRWRLVLRANAITSGCWVVSANRPRPEHGASIGGPSVVISPSGDVIAETTDPLHTVTLDRSSVISARAEYPGYLGRFPDLYARSWSAVADDAQERV